MTSLEVIFHATLKAVEISGPLVAIAAGLFAWVFRGDIRAWIGGLR